MNCSGLQVWAGNAARATQERNRTAEPASNYSQIRWVIELHRRRTSSSQAAYRSACRKRQASFTPLLVLSPRRRKRHIPRFRRKAKARSFCCGSSPRERRSAFRGVPGFASLGFGGAPIKGGTRGKRARLALKGPFRACCPMASFAYFPSLESRPSETLVATSFISFASP